MIESYVIRMKGVLPSEQLANDCVKSGKRFNIDILEFDAVWGDQVDVEFEKYNLFSFEKTKPHRKVRGVKGCFLSHYILWKRSLENNIPILIFEHDAEIIREIPFEYFETIDFDVLNLDAHSRTILDYEQHLTEDYGTDIEQHGSTLIKDPSFSLLNNTSIKGLHSYIVRPSGAEKLIKQSSEHGVLPADIAVNGYWCSLFKTKTSYCRLNPKSWIDKKKSSVHSFTKS
jgi:GR25 family glycosyltransferase involved in LPS biosynthesis